MQENKEKFYTLSSFLFSFSNTILYICMYVLEVLLSLSSVHVQNDYHPSVKLPIAKNNVLLMFAIPDVNTRKTGVSACN